MSLVMVTPTVINGIIMMHDRDGKGTLQTQQMLQIS